jgi:type 1 glutamine amidotransferase
MLMAIQYHQGRTFHTALGHDTAGFECVGFITTFKRGVEWAATGKVTQSGIPEDFPSAEATSSRTFELKKK